MLLQLSQLLLFSSSLVCKSVFFLLNYGNSHKTPKIWLFQDLWEWEVWKALYGFCWKTVSVCILSCLLFCISFKRKAVSKEKGKSPCFKWRITGYRKPAFVYSTRSSSASSKCSQNTFESSGGIEKSVECLITEAHRTSPNYETSMKSIKLKISLYQDPCCLLTTVFVLFNIRWQVYWDNGQKIYLKRFIWEIRRSLNKICGSFVGKGVEGEMIMGLVKLGHWQLRDAQNAEMRILTKWYCVVQVVKSIIRKTGLDLYRSLIWRDKEMTYRFLDVLRFSSLSISDVYAAKRCYAR